MKMIKTLAMVSMVGFATFGTTAQAGVLEDATATVKALSQLKLYADNLAIEVRNGKGALDVLNGSASAIKMKQLLDGYDTYTGVDIINSSSIIKAVTYADTASNTELPNTLEHDDVFPTNYDDVGALTSAVADGS